MSLLPDPDAKNAPASTAGIQPIVVTAGTPNILELLDEMGLGFVMHTHHPLTHLVEFDAQAEGAGDTTIRLECTDPPPMGTPSGVIFSN